MVSTLQIDLQRQHTMVNLRYGNDHEISHLMGNQFPHYDDFPFQEQIYSHQHGINNVYTWLHTQVGQTHVYTWVLHPKSGISHIHNQDSNGDYLGSPHHRTLVYICYVLLDQFKEKHFIMLKTYHNDAKELPTLEPQPMLPPWHSQL